MVENRRDLMGMLRAIPSVSNNTFVATRFFVLYQKRNIYRKMCNTLFGVYEDLDIRRNKHAKCRLQMLKVLQSYGIFLLIFTQLSQIVDFTVNYIRHGTEVYNIQIWLPFDHNTDLTYFLSCFWISFTGLFCSSALYIGDWLIYSITTVASVEFRVIGKKFREILNDPNVKLEDLGPLIEKHNNVIDVCNQLELIVSKLLLHNCLQGTLIICLICFQIVILEDPTQLIVYVLVLVIVLSQSFLMCYHGQMLIDSSLSVADEIYASNWDEIKDEKVKKSIVLLLGFCQIPKYLTARGFAVVSVALFTSVS
jgi:gustatory receptor